LKRPSGNTDDSRLLGVVAAVAVIATLYFGRTVFLPLALAVLSSFLLTPPVGLLERIKLPRVVAILLVVGTLVSLIGLIGWKTSQQFVDLSNELPTYRKTFQDKIQAMRGSGSQSFNKFSETVKELKEQIGTAASGSSATNEARKNPVPPGASPSRPLAVEVVPPTNPLEYIENLLGPLATAGIVIIFTIFILIGREDLRNRVIRLAGRGRLNIVTQAMDEATQRIKRYLFLQLIVNSGYGLVVFGGLHLFGIPNAMLWGVGAAILRFLPYVGPPIAALMPIALSLAVFPGWQHALFTAGLFLVLELAVANFVEPLLYGAHLGLSPLAILVAGVFWTLIWGLPGLLLSTPLTVCLVVMGRYLPSLSFLNILLGDEPALSPHLRYYQRLLATDQTEARQILEEYVKRKGLEDAYSSVVIPALSLAEQDRHHNELDEENQNYICQSTREIIEELADTSSELRTRNTGDVSADDTRRKIEETEVVDVLCIPARDDADALVALLLSQLLGRQGCKAQSIPIGTAAEMLAQVAELDPGVVCISALPPFVVDHARALYRKLRAQAPNLYIVICLWHFEGDLQKAAARLKMSGSHGFFTTLSQVLQNITNRTQDVAIVTKQV
jgi:predicted PurR-regulated permease PerM